MKPSRYIVDLSRSTSAIRLTQAELTELAALDISVSDTETTGRPPQDLGLTELASQRGLVDAATGKLQHVMFQARILPLRPQYRDYLAACDEAKAQGLPKPPYDRRRYEYEIDPRALAVTGSAFIRKPLDGPITGLRVGGKKIPAQPFYEVMDDFLAFTRNGVNDCYYNMPFDARVLAGQIADVRAHEAASSNRHQQLTPAQWAKLSEKDRDWLAQYYEVDYTALSDAERARLTTMLKSVVEVPEAYLDPAKFQCIYLGELAKEGFHASNRLDDAYRRSVDPSFDKRADHKADEDTTMATRVALQQARDGKIDSVRGLFERLVRRADPDAQVDSLPPREAKKGQWVRGDLAITFSDEPAAMTAHAKKLWDFLVAFEEVTKANPRVPKHLLQVDAANHTITISAERSNPLSLNLLKKLIFFIQLQHSTVIDTLQPHHSTGTEMDVVLQASALHPAQIIEDVNYTSLRANRAFLEAHPGQAGEYCALIAGLLKADERVGVVLLRERADGDIDIVLQGHVKAFGECVMRLQHGGSITRAIPGLQRELVEQMKLGAIPYVIGLGVEEEPDAEDAGALEGENDTARTPHVPVQLAAGIGKALQLTVTAPIFTLMAHRLGKTPEELVAQQRFGSKDAHAVSIRYEPAGEGKNPNDARYIITGNREAFHDFVMLEHESAQGERPSNLLKDASWLLYRLEQIPGTYGLTLDGDMATLDQRDGVSLEALGLLTRLGIPHKAYGTKIKLDAGQLMKEAFHWSVALSRAQKERQVELRRGDLQGDHAPAAYLSAVHRALIQHPNCALETDERRQSWLLDGSVDAQGKTNHYALNENHPSPSFAFNGHVLVPEESDLETIGSVRVMIRADGSAKLHTTRALVRALVAHQLPPAMAHMVLQGESVPPTQAKKLRQAAQLTARFLMELEKTTGSQRLPWHRAEPVEDAVHFTLPPLSFLPRPELFDAMLKIHQQMATNTSGKTMQHVRRHLPDLLQADARRDNLLELADSLGREHPAFETLKRDIRQLQALLKRHYVSGELRDELGTLGTLRHELFSTGGSAEHMPPSLVNDIGLAQERLSNIAFGSDQLRDHLSEAEKALQKLQESSGTALGEAMEHYAQRLALYRPGMAVSELMQPYEDQLTALVGKDVDLQTLAYRGALRALRATAADPAAFAPPVLHYLMEHGMPNMSLPQREAVMALYRHGDTSEQVEQIHDAFPRGRAPAENASSILQQFRLLTGQEHYAEPGQDGYAGIELKITNAYANRGRMYLTMARIFERSDWAEEREKGAQWLSEALQCFRQSGKSEEQITKALASSLKRNWSEKWHQHCAERIALQVPADSTKEKLLLQTIDEPGHEEAVYALMEQNVLRAQDLHATQLVGDALDPYREYRQRRGLMNAVAKFLKESHDLQMGTFHYLRDLSALLVLGQQDTRVSDMFDAEGQTGQITAIGAAITSAPELVGMHDKTVANIHDWVRDLRHGMVARSSEHMRAQGVKTLDVADDHVRMPMRELEAWFDRWRAAQKAKDAGMPAHMDRWVNRTTATLQTLRKPVTAYAVALDRPVIQCQLDLPKDAAARVASWARLQLALTGTGAKLPAMPEDGGEQVVTLSFPRAVLRAHAEFSPSFAPGDPRAMRLLGEALRHYAVSEGMEPAEADRFAKRALRQRVHVEGALAHAHRQGYDTEPVRQVLAGPQR